MKSEFAAFFGVLVALFSTRAYCQGTLLTTVYPSLIVPLHQDDPDTAYHTQFGGDIQRINNSQKITTEILFDVPSNAASTCHLNFTIALGSSGGPWTLSGNNGGPAVFSIYALDGIVNNTADTWNTHPQVGDRIASVELNNAGVDQILGNGPVTCAKGETANFLLSPDAEYGGDFTFTWYELNSPIHGITYEMWS